MRLAPHRYQRHVFVCVNEKDFGKHCCGRNGSWDILKALRDHVNKNGLMARYNITKSLCQGHCLEGPAITIYPDGKTFTSVSMDDVPSIIEEFLSP